MPAIISFIGEKSRGMDCCIQEPHSKQISCVEPFVGRGQSVRQVPRAGHLPYPVAHHSPRGCQTEQDKTRCAFLYGIREKTPSHVLEKVWLGDSKHDGQVRDANNVW
jgi:hypothetical protein